MMNPKLKQRWVQALRSGDYQQCKHQLKNDVNQFCVIGVLFDIIKDDIDGYWDENNKFIFSFENSNANKFDLDKIANLQLNYKYGEDFYPTFLVDLNDEDSLTFEQLADLIEEQL